MSKVTIYTSNNCGSCKMVKKFLQIKGADYSELNIDENPSLRQEVISLSGAMTVPVIAVSDDSGSIKGVSVGYNPSQLSSLLAA